MAAAGEGEVVAQRILRITDIAQEPLEFLTPIIGFGEMPLVPLEIAVEPLVPILPNVQSHVYVAKQRCKKPADGLSQDESASIMLYTMGWKPLNTCLYVVLNATLRSKDRERLEPWFLYLRLLFEALFRLPSLSKVAYRGVKLDMSNEYTVGETVVWWGFSSCTTAIGVLQSELFLGTIGTRTMFNIHCESAKNIRKHSYYPAEDEVLLLAATQFEVISCLRQGDLHIIQLEETRPPHPLLQPIPVVPHPTSPSSTEHDVKNKYENYLSFGAMPTDNNLVNIAPHTALSDPDNSELDAMNWYETAMLDIEPDITTIINNHQHPIFRYKWNAEKWNQQMKMAEEIDRRSNKYDLNRHLLRVTVMLNTIAVLRKKKYVVDGKEVILNLERMRTIGYNHQAKLLDGKIIDQTELKTPYPSTTVKVVNEDCLVRYEQLVSEGHRPLLLNMANAVNPGGGYRKGHGGQEENLFRRSDYYQSLDEDICDKDRTERLYCTPKCELKPLKGFATFYPMEAFGAVYTSGITVFRQTEAKGYAYMKKPLYNVCAVAMAAYREPYLNNKNMLEKKPAINTHRKIENIFAIAHRHGHDSLVLSAFGCGALRNPPEHIALLFKSVIYQYAGYFKKIYFAIIDDYNRGHQISPDGNFLPFKKILDGLQVRPPKTLPVDGISGPHRILNKSPDGQLTLDDAYISQLPPCQHGTDCRDVKDAGHNRQFSHPPMCSLQDADTKCDQINDEVHTFTFMHTVKCKYGGECTSKDNAHFTGYDHPDFCKDESYCHDISPDHLFAFRHLPPCRDGIECSKYLNHDSDHMKSFRHCKSICPEDNCCTSFHDEKHFGNIIHSFRWPCPFTPYNCTKYVQFIQRDRAKKLSREVEDHCLRYSHICPYGRQCRTTDDKHYETSIHIARHLCLDGTSCSKIGEEAHLESVSHPDIRDIRLFCNEPGFKCSNKWASDHHRRFRHGQNHNYFNIVPSSNLNSHIDFAQNQKQLIRAVNSYVDASNWKKARISYEILRWIRALQSVHRCNPVIFESILVHGYVMSRHYMKLLNRPKHVAKAVMQHPRVRLIFLRHHSHAVKDSASDYIKGLITTEFSKTEMDGITTATLDPDHEEQTNIARMRLRAASLTDDDMKVIHDWTVKIAQASITLHNAPMGIGFDVDEKMGTDKHIFSILGPHYGHYYGDIIITFKQEILFHPDTNFSVQAATGFHSAKTYQHRPWVKDRGTDDTRVEDFNNSKLHCSVPRYEYAAATELIALTGKDKRSMDVDLSAVRQRWSNVDSHFVFEGHLPQLIPLDYIDCVYMSQNVFDTLTPEARRSAKAAFHSLVITTHTIDLSIKPTINVPLDLSRQAYQKFVLDKIDEKIKERMDRPRSSHGIVITVPGSRFREHIVLPITLSQSYNLYCLDNPRAPNNAEYTYIYWQAMHGDMMLTIANQRLESKGKDQSNIRCLVCYVAEKPSTKRDDYHEEYSYLNDGHPLRHDINVADTKFLAKSKVFYRGCNTDDFLTFCLKIAHKTNEVTLSHAGPNGIYNHEKIYYRFDRSDLDLSRVDYVHVSGGKQDVPIRNLTINHERVPELHPSFDKDFKIDTSGLFGRRRLSVDHVARPAYHDTEHHNKNVASEPHKQRSVSVQPPAQTEKPSFFRRLKNALLNHPTDEEASLVSNLSMSSSTTVTLAAFSPCPDSVYCLQQDLLDHTRKYSHPCPFNELCQNKTDEPHLVHERHNVPTCSQDKNCSEKTNPVHRAKYRHTQLPDYLIPCRYQNKCFDTSVSHRIKYFHGEALPLIEKSK